MTEQGQDRTEGRTVDRTQDRRPAVDPDRQLLRIRRLCQFILDNTSSGLLYVSPDTVWDLATSVEELDQYLSSSGMPPEQWR